MIVVS